MHLKFKKDIYPIQAIRNAIYWLSSKYEIILDESEDSFIVDCSNEDENFKQEFTKSLNDFVLRHQIEEESKEIRTLVTAKAFYPDLVNFNDIGEFDDPIDIAKNNGDQPD